MAQQTNRSTGTTPTSSLKPQKHFKYLEMKPPTRRIEGHKITTWHSDQKLVQIQKQFPSSHALETEPSASKHKKILVSTLIVWINIHINITDTWMCIYRQSRYLNWSCRSYTTILEQFNMAALPEYRQLLSCLSCSKSIDSSEMQQSGLA